MSNTQSLDQLLRLSVKQDASGNLGLNSIAESGSLSTVDLSRLSKEQILRALFSDNGDGTWGINLFGIAGGSGGTSYNVVTPTSYANLAAQIAATANNSITQDTTRKDVVIKDSTGDTVTILGDPSVVVTSSTGTSTAYNTTEYVTAAVTRTLPTAATSDIGKIITYKATGAAITIAVGANTIDGASSSITIAAGDSITFAVRAANSVERVYGLVASSGGNSSLTTTTVGTAIFQYEILTGTPVIGYTKTGGAGNGVMTCTGGTIKLRQFIDDILAADLASTAIRFDLVGTGTVAKLARSFTPAKYTLNATDALADASTNATVANQVDIDNTPPVKYGNIVLTSHGAMSIRLDNVTVDTGISFKW